MTFSSLLFLFLFLPIVLTGYLLVGRKGRNFFLLGASLFFYAWGETFFVFILLITMVFNFFFALLIETFKKAPSVKLFNPRWLLWLAVLFNLGLLIIYKYLSFLTTNLNWMTQAWGLSYTLTAPSFYLPLGLSFFTFRSISYVIDVYRGQVEASKKWVSLFLYFSFFPLAIAGPIARFSEMASGMVNRAFQVEEFLSGMKRFIVGLGKKILIANTLASVADRIFSLPPGQLPAELAWLGVLCYTLQIYFDFSGYSDMAIGLGKIFGFHILENFNYPYISQSIREFWRRWHISLSTWFRDYVYISMGGNQAGSVRVYVNLITVFLLCGLWHDAQWTFVVWGLWHGFFIVLERLGLNRRLASVWKPLRHTYVLVVVSLGWVFFRAETLSQALELFQALFGFSKADRLEFPIQLFLNREVTLALLAAMIFSGPIKMYSEKILEIVWAGSGGLTGRVIEWGLTFGSILLLGIIFLSSVMALAGGTYNPFIYFRF